MKGSRKWEALLAIVGLGLLAFSVSKIGWSAVVDAFEKAAVAILIIAVLSLMRMLVQTFSWSTALRSEGFAPPILELLLIRLASQGVGYLSVLGPVASEPMKISLLRRTEPHGERSHGAQLSGAAATLVDTGVYWFTSGLVGIAGSLAAALLFARSRYSVATLSIFGLLLVGSLVLIARPKPRLPALVNRLGARTPRWLEKAKQIELAIREFKNLHPASIRRMFLLDIVCQLLLAAEIVVLFWFLRMPLHAGTVLAIEGASRAIKIMAGWMPARIGADESGFAGAFAALGLPAASGLTLALARRSRDLLGALIGLTWLTATAGFWRVSPNLLSDKESTTCKAC
jgi:hypothetical protein